MKEDHRIRRGLVHDAKAIHGVVLSAFEQHRDYCTPEAFADAALSVRARPLRIQIFGS